MHLIDGVISLYRSGFRRRSFLCAGRRVSRPVTVLTVDQCKNAYWKNENFVEFWSSISTNNRGVIFSDPAGLMQMLLAPAVNVMYVPLVASPYC
jgi:hypothetical protein